MSDTVTLPGNGVVVASDDAGADGQVQLVKLALSADGSAVPITATSDGLLVNLGSNNDVTVTGTVTANAGTGTLAVSLAALPALPAGTNNIGDVDVLTLPNVTLAAGTNTNEVVGDVAEDAALAGNPIRTGARASTAIPTAMSADNDVVTAWADLNGALVVKPRPAATGTLANVSGSASSVTLVSSNTSRLGAIIVNDSTAVCYLKYGSTASSTSFTYKLQPGMTWEMPANVLYTGIITGIWSSATGSARVTELTT